MDSPSVGQPRRHMGHDSQIIISDSLLHYYSATFVALSTVGQKTPDLVLQHDQDLVQVEIKGRDCHTSPLTFFEKSARRDDCHSVTLQQLARIYSNDEINSFQELIDSYRQHDSAVGFPGDDGVVKSGKIPKQLTIKDNCDVLDRLRLYAIQCLHDHNNNFFAIHNRTAENMEMFYTGYGKNVFNAPLLPRFKEASLATYGSSYKGAMRVALKIKLEPTEYALLPVIYR